MLGDYRKGKKENVWFNQEKSLMLLEFPKNRTIDQLLAGKAKFLEVLQKKFL